ncbi:DUF3025 domain-containing protein [Craterilacuibacter sp.]|uniref:DUF3025 domain-containing protein n=1 Tax=Craterilacuibacter sp. TaxID=2870909 RepID=UPI003F379D2B
MTTSNFPPAPAPFFATLDTLAPLLASLQDWPQQQDFDALLAGARTAGIKLPASLHFACDLEPDAYYEMHIGCTGEVPTRTQNWHDWFNALCWLIWPKTKTALNARHVRAIERGEVKRGPLRDAATLLDECGVIVASCRPDLLAALDEMDWQRLFIDHRDAWGQEVLPRVLGHAIFEQALTPHPGWCAKALLVQVEADFFNLSPAAQLSILDSRLACALDDDNWLSSPRQMPPLPLLGIPGWDDANLDPAYYQNSRYFCTTRRAKSASVVLSS